jgi:hypothetical protein
MKFQFIVRCLSLPALLFIQFSSAKAQTPAWVSLATQDVKLASEQAFCLYVADINNDHYPDLVTVEGAWSAVAENNLRVYMNVHDTGSSDPAARIFVDVTAASGVNAKPGSTDPSRGTLVVALADINNDGNIDMVRGNYYHRLNGFNDQGDRCEVLLGDGQGHFTLVPNNGLHELGLVNTIGFSFLDYNKDGNIDLFIAPWFKDYDADIWQPGYLMKGNGDGTFTDVSAQAGITKPEPMYGASIVDWNNDGWPDIATAPYCRTRGQLLKNNGDGTFTDVAVAVGYNAKYMQGYTGRDLCMWSAAPEDYDNDGDMDFFFALVHGGATAGEGRSAIALNGGAAANYALTIDRSLITRKIPMSSHMGDYDASWFDLDNDGLLDVAMTQGTYETATDRLYIFRHLASHKLEDITGDLGLLGTSLRDMHFVEAIDYDRDGDDDIVVCRNGQPRNLHLIRNRIGQDNNWTGVHLRAPAGVNKSCIGARIYVWSGGVKRMREVYAGRGNGAGQQPFAMLFGLGSSTSIDSITVAWPDAAGTQTTVRNPPINRYLEITGSGLSVAGTESHAQAPVLKLYPNPARDFILVQLSDNSIPASIVIYDMTGRKMDQAKAFPADQITYCSVKDLPGGQYIVKVIARNGKTFTQTFVKTSQE